LNETPTPDAPHGLAPLPSGQLQPREALWFGASLLVAGNALSVVGDNALAAILGT